MPLTTVMMPPDRSSILMLCSDYSSFRLDWLLVVCVLVFVAHTHTHEPNSASSVLLLLYANLAFTVAVACVTNPLNLGICLFSRISKLEMRYEEGEGWEFDGNFRMRNMDICLLSFGSTHTLSNPTTCWSKRSKDKRERNLNSQSDIVSPSPPSSSLSSSSLSQSPVQLHHATHVTYVPMHRRTRTLVRGQPQPFKLKIRGRTRGQAEAEEEEAEAEEEK